MMSIKRISILMLFTLLMSFSAFVLADNLNALLRSPNNPIAGNRNGKITIVEFFDYQCSHCKTMAKVIDAAMHKNPDLRVVYKDFPIRGPMSEFAARAAIAAGKQGKYYQLYHAILSLANPLTEESVLNAAQSINLNMDRLKKDMNSKEVMDQVKSNVDLATELKISGTPAFYIGKTDATTMSELNFILGEMNQTELQQAVDLAKQ